jgi:cytochrome b6-f complex iron-sulfur subunit
MTQVPPPQSAAGPEPARRSALAWLAGVLGLTAMVEFGWLVTRFLAPRPDGGRQGNADAVVIAGSVDRFEKGTVTAFPRGRFYLARLEDGGFLALSRQCTHLGCTLPWVADAKQFRCPCHASAFNLRGEAIQPPATRPLDLFPIRIENHVLSVDTSRRVRRSTFREAQVAHDA